MAITVTNRARLRFDEFDTKVIEQIQTDLTIKNPDWLAAKKYSPWGMAYSKIPEYLRNYERTDEWIDVPTGYDFTKHLNGGFLIKDKRVLVPAKFPKPLIKLFSWQKEVGVAVEKAGGGTILAEVSAGKTIGALEVARHLGQRTLVLLHRMPLFEGWMADIKKYLGLSGDAVGLIKQTIWRVRSPITLASVQTLGRRNLVPLLKEFGLIIADEGQLFPATHWKKTVDPFWARYKITITATPTRRDKKECLMYQSFGPICYTVQEKSAVPLQVKIVQTDFYYDSFLWHEIEEVMIHDAKRNSLIIEEIVKNYFKQQCTLVLVRRREHGRILKKLLKEKGIMSTLMLGGQEENQTRFRAAQSGLIPVTIATYSLVALGSNVPPWQTAILAAPIRDRNLLTQSLGRIRRKFKGKDVAYVVDFVDDVKVLLRAYRERMNWFDKHATVSLATSDL